VNKLKKLPEPQQDELETLKKALQVPEKAPKRVKKLSAQEAAYMKLLCDKYGENYKAMAKDINLNYWQYSAGQMKKRLKLYLNPSQNILYEFPAGTVL